MCYKMTKKYEILSSTVMSQTTDRVRWTIQDVTALPDNEWIGYLTS